MGNLSIPPQDMHAVCQNTYDCKSISAIDIGWGHNLGSANILSICGPDVRFRSFLQSRSKAFLGSEVIVT